MTEFTHCNPNRAPRNALGPVVAHGPEGAPASAPWRGRGLLDLGFLELDVLADLRVVLPQGELLGRAARVLLGRVEVPGAGRAHELDQHRSGLGHDERSLRVVASWRGRLASGPPLSRCAW